MDRGTGHRVDQSALLGDSRVTWFATVSTAVGSLRIALFLMILCCWVVFYMFEMYPREGFVLWVARDGAGGVFARALAAGATALYLIAANPAPTSLSVRVSAVLPSRWEDDGAPLGPAVDCLNITT